MSFSWLIADVDEGILRREASLKAARAWVRRYGEGQMRLNYAYSSGLAYDYTVTSPDETGWKVTILRADQAGAYGFEWAFELPDQFPYPTDPYRHAALTDDERSELRDHIEKAISPKE